MCVCARDIYPMLLYCWADVLEDGQMINKSLIRLRNSRLHNDHDDVPLGDERSLILIQSNSGSRHTSVIVMRHYRLSI